MNRSLLLRSLPVALALLSIGSVAQAQDAEALARERANLPDAVRKIADGNNGPATASNKPRSTVPDPSQWKKDETHKVAVLDVEFGGRSETIMFELFDKAAPETVANFAENAAAGSYRGLAFHRAIRDYLVQTGDPLTADDSKRNTWGTGGEDKTVAAEIKLPHKVGAVAMARRGDSVNPSHASNGYQFYFALGNMSSLDGSYTVFGQVVSGLDVLQAISRVPVDSNDCPLSRVEVKSVRVVDQKGPLIVMHDGSKARRFTKPSAAKSALTRFIERVW